jgi:hypothetical protein
MHTKKCKLKVTQCMHDHTFSRFMYNNSKKSNLLKCWHLIIMPNFMTIQKNRDITTHILWIFSQIKCTNKTHALNTVTLSSSICVASFPSTFEATKIATAFLINCHHETHLVCFWCISICTTKNETAFLHDMQKIIKTHWKQRNKSIMMVTCTYS